MTELLYAIIVILILWIISIQKYSQFLNGFWSADNSFLEKSQLREMDLFISPSGWGNLSIINKDGEIIFDDPVYIKRGWFLLSLFSLFSVNDCISQRVYIDYGDGNNPFPNKLTMKISIHNGALELLSEGQTYAYLNKDHNASQVALGQLSE